MLEQRILLLITGEGLVHLLGCARWTSLTLAKGIRLGAGPTLAEAITMLQRSVGLCLLEKLIERI